jgi:hypothetical protein
MTLGASAHGGGPFNQHGLTLDTTSCEVSELETTAGKVLSWESAAITEARLRKTAMTALPRLMGLIVRGRTALHYRGKEY